MLRRSPYNVCFPILRSRPLVLPSVRLASFKVDKAKAKDAPATRADHKIARHTPVPPTPNDDESSEETMRERVTRIVQWAVVAFLAFHVCTEFFYLPTGAYGVSMLPTLNSSGDLLLISKLYRKGRKVEVGDLVSYKHPLRPGEFAIKRVLGLAGDFVLMYTPGKSDTMIQVPEGHCWVVGDNLSYSRDSRLFGPLPLALIKGKPIARLEWSGTGWLPNFSMIDHGLQDSDESDNSVD